MRALLPHPVKDADVHQHYAAGWLDRGGLRVNFVSSVDGAANAAGVSKGLQTAGDNIVFAALRDLADVVLVGSGTAVAESYRPARFSERRRSIRADLGLAESMPIAVLSRTLRLDPGSGLFVAAPTAYPTIVLTCAAADAETKRALQRVANVVECGEQTIDSTLARAALEERGLTRILSEGGPSAFKDLLRDRVVDELCLSVSPILVGGAAGRILGGPDAPEPTALTLAGLLEDHDALFARYVVVGDTA